MKEVNRLTYLLIKILTLKYNFKKKTLFHNLIIKDYIYISIIGSI